jgi:hypothetical protein
MKIEKNIGSIDRIIRLVAAVVLAVLYFTGVVSGALGIGLLVVAVVLVLTSVVSVCPAYLPFKFSTRK